MSRRSNRNIDLNQPRPKQTKIPDNLSDLLNGQYFVSGLDEHQQERLLASATFHQLPAGNHLFRQQDAADYFFIIRHGLIKLYRLSADGDEKIMGLSGPNASFAEGVLFMQRPHYPVNAQALEKSEVIGLHRETYLAILSESFPACLSVMAEVTKRIQGLLNEIESLTLRDSRYRVVSFLVALLPAATDTPTTVHLPARKSAIAARLSIRPETLSRTLRVLSTEGLIEVHDDSVVIPEPAALRAIVRI